MPLKPNFKTKPNFKKQTSPFHSKGDKSKNKPLKPGLSNNKYELPDGKSHCLLCRSRRENERRLEADCTKLTESKCKREN